MTSELNLATISFLIGLTATGYALATYGMKLSTGGLTPLSLALVALGLLAAVGAEILLLRNGELSIVYIAIIGFETLLVLLLAVWLGESVTPLQIAGAGLVLGGMALVLH
ncbi:MAG: 5-aminolevulinate synthase [Pseudooceanicola sp.]|nr:5-aminolevulinate synthase [Pseudooceanicola sp.]